MTLVKNQPNVFVYTTKLFINERRASFQEIILWRLSFPLEISTHAQGANFTVAIVCLHRYTIKAGGHHLGDRKTSPEQLIEATKIFIHDNYKRRNHENDIALVKLNRKVKLGKYVSPVCLPEKDKDLAIPGKHGYVAGWGEKQTHMKQERKSSGRQSRKKSRSRVTLHIALSILSKKVCINSTKQVFNSSLMFCAGEGEKSGQQPCRGDGGGPFLRDRYDSRSRRYRWTVTGLVSWGEGCGTKGRYNFFTRVEPYFDWITETMNPPKRGGRRLRRQRKRNGRN